MKTPDIRLSNPMEDAASRLPRLAFWILLGAFILPGLFGRDFWSYDEIRSFAAVLGVGDAGSLLGTLCPSVLGVPATGTPPLIVWIASFSVAIFGWLTGPEAAARIAVALFYAAGCAALWFATWNFSRRHEAQPVTLPFIKKITMRHYARLMADAALLMAISTLGLFVPMRELTPAVAAFALTSGYLLSIIWSVDRKPLSVFLTGLACAFAALGVDFWFGLVLLAVAALLHVKLHIFDSSSGVRLTWLAAGFILPFALWFAAAFASDAQGAAAWFSVYAKAQAALYDKGYLEEWLSKNIVWFAWPVWAYAAYCLKVYAKTRTRTHIRVPLFVTLGIFAGGLVFATEPKVLLTAMVAPLAVLSGYGVSATKEAARWLDRISTLLATVAVIVLWTGYVAWHAGRPTFYVEWLSALSAGAGLSAHGMRIALAIVATLVWIAMILWRLGFTHSHFWKGPWLSAVGITCVAVIATNLFNTAIDANQSMRPAAQAMRADFASLAERGGCVAALGLEPEQERILAFWGVPFAKGPCAWRLVEEGRLKREDPEGLRYERVRPPYSRPDERRVYLLVKER